MKPIIHPLADMDVEHQVEYLLRANADEQKWVEFFTAIRKAVEKIEKHPLTWSRVRGSKQVRKVQIPRFRMQAFYVVQENGVPIILEFAGPGLQPRWADRL